MRPHDAMRMAVDSLISPPASVDLALEIVGGRSELAQRIAGTSDKSSKEYKAAMRNVQRYTAAEGKQRRTPTAAMRQRIRDAIMPELRNRTIARMGRRGVTVKHLDALVQVSDDERWRTVDDIRIDGATLRATDFVANATAGRWGTAADDFAVAWGISYGLGPCVFIEVDSLELGWR